MESKSFLDGPKIDSKPLSNSEVYNPNIESRERFNIHSSESKASFLDLLDPSESTFNHLPIQLSIFYTICFFETSIYL